MSNPCSSGQFSTPQPCGGQPPYGNQQSNPGYPSDMQPYPHQLSSAQGYVPGPDGPKSWVVALLLAYFLGIIGAHNFYLGHKRRGIAQFSLWVLGFLTIIFFVGIIFWIPLYVWYMVEFFLILLRSGSYGADARGIALR